MWKYLVSGLLLVLIACTEQPAETVNYDELAPGSGKYNDKQSDKPIDSSIVNERPESSLFLAIVDTMMLESRWVKWDTLLFPDRFGPNAQEKWMTIGTKDSLVLLRYQFKDSLRTKNAFFNWIDCFGPKCKSYTVGANIRIPKRAALWLVGSKELVIIEGNKAIDEKLIREILSKDPKKENWLYLVNIPKSGKTTWKRIDKGEEKPIVKTDENS
ncbi:MAG: hypothetical protein A3D31_19105 [Candidatus Fluviicola riflensis]|nr:MAG: hypothetical protein CHH17_05830 [Candidatus Fluviicola riflensis]OGS75897.1 MAG: hypothetical protein A3D31_19105 [Candidatus Fluviicola riflensis]OGS83577.1 MAG: hypothetical protein A2724_19120 [Fluviicola sp. RIFCSPHIGHO2_01_FULL_43_53]OGS85716.1 MAG: hypothetical protein A3E30_18650 [Fluviicola sp. RIFCSPHIGHO2_12_FULL_43_24]